MRICLVSVSAPPKVTGAETIQVAKYLRHICTRNEVTLVTTVAPENHWQKKDKSLLPLLNNLEQLIELRTIPALGKYTGFIPRRIFRNQFSKPDPDFLFHHQASIAFQMMRNTPDIIYSRSAPFSSAVMAFKLKKYLKKPWVMHLSDPWSDAIVSANDSYSHEMEARCFEFADRISFTTEETKYFYKQKYPALESKFFISPNVYEISEIGLEKMQFTDGKLKAVFSGAVLDRRKIDPLLDGLVNLSEKERSLLEIKVVGAIDSENLEKIEKSELNCVHYGGFVTPTASYKIQRDADILISIDHIKEAAIDLVYLPSKIQDYMAARRSIFAITDSDSATNHAIEGKFGSCFSHDDIEGMTNYWRGMIKNVQDQNYLPLRAGLLTGEFEAGRNADRLIDEFEQLVKKS